MVDGVVGSGEGWAWVLDADHSGLLECWGLLGWPVPARGDREALWNQSLWPNLRGRDQCVVRQRHKLLMKAWQLGKLQADKLSPTLEGKGPCVIPL